MNQIHIARNGKQEGPYSLEQVQGLLQSGQLKTGDLSWWEGCAGWVPVSEIPGLRSGSGGGSAVQDPYAAPQAHLTPASHAGGVSPGAVLALRQTRPWVLFIAILGALFTALMILAGLVMVGIGGFAGASGFGGGASGSSPFPAAMMIGMSVMYLLFGLLYLYPVIKLFKYAGAIGALNRSGSPADLERALQEQKSFWKFLGIMIIIGIIAYIAMIGLAVAGGVLWRSSSPPGGGSPSFPTAPISPTAP